MTESDKIFSEMILEHAAALRRFALSLCRNEFDADDLVAETIMKAYENFKGLKDKGKMKQWLFRILSNTYISCYRTNKRFSSMSVSIGSENGRDFSLFEALENSTFTDAGNPEKDFVNMITGEKIEAAIKLLNVDFRIPLELCDKEDFSYSEIAVILKIPVGTVRSRIARARAILQKRLWQEAKEMGIKKIKKKKKPEGYVCTCGRDENEIKQKAVLI